MYSKSNRILKIALLFTIGLVCITLFGYQHKPPKMEVVFANQKQAQADTVSLDSVQEKNTTSIQGSKDTISGDQNQKAKNEVDALKQKERFRQYSQEAVILVILVITLLAGLFWFLLHYYRRREMAGYYGQVYGDSVENFEYRRKLLPVTEKWEIRDYHEEIKREKIFPEPEPDSELIKLAIELDRQDEIRTSTDIFRRNQRTDPWDTRAPSASRAGLGGPGRGKQGEHETEKDKNFRKLLNVWNSELHKWKENIDSEAYKRYDADRKKASKKAKELSKSATGDIDLSALRGRGSAFILEFTALVIIIFASVILGILERLGEEQIGTLLAAIAGYVLGKATTESQKSKKAES